MAVDDLAHAQSAVAALLTDLERDQWSRPTPCDDWDVAGVTRHLVVGERAFTVSLGGERYDLPAIAAEVDAIAPTGLQAVYAEGAVALREALIGADPASGFPTGLGPMPAP